MWGSDLNATLVDHRQENLDRVRDCRAGIDAGSGFFEYDDPPEAVARRRDEAVAAIRRALEERSD